jgi:hypothetical protein
VTTHRRRPWTPAEDRRLRKLFPNRPTKELSTLLRRSVAAVYNRAYGLGLRKTAAYLASPAACRLRRGDNVGAAHRFRPGHVPANKGLRRPGWSPGRMRETQFKPGRPANEARNYRPIGSTRVLNGVLERKVTDDPNLYPARRWVPVARLVWESERGPIPPGMAVTFRPGLQTIIESEITIDRLELATRADLMRRNTVHNLPKPLARVVQLRGALIRQINRRSRA